MAIVTTDTITTAITTMVGITTMEEDGAGLVWGWGAGAGVVGGVERLQAVRMSRARKRKRCIVAFRDRGPGEFDAKDIPQEL